MFVREKIPDSSGNLLPNQLRDFDGPDIPNIHPHTGGTPGHGLGGSQSFSGIGKHSNVDSFEQSIMRKPGSLGWCRRCMIDGMTMEGLVLHSQTRSTKT